GPPNNSAPNHVGVIVLFTVDRLPPNLSVDIDSGDPGPGNEITINEGGVIMDVTSGNGDLNNDNDRFNDFGAANEIVINAPDASHPMATITKCIIDGGIPCDQVDVEGTTHYYFHGLTDGINPHTVEVEAQDTCGNINSVSVTVPWIVDSHGNDIAFQD